MSLCFLFFSNDFQAHRDFAGFAQDVDGQPGQALVAVDAADAALHSLQGAFGDDDFVALEIALGEVHKPFPMLGLCMRRRQAADGFNIIRGHGGPFFAGAEDAGHAGNPFQGLVELLRVLADDKQITGKQQLFAGLPFSPVFFLSYRARREYFLKILLDSVASNLLDEPVFASCWYL